MSRGIFFFRFTSRCPKSGIVLVCIRKVTILFSTIVPYAMAFNFRLIFNQPIHCTVSGARIVRTASLTLLHRQDPMVLHTTGYELLDSLWAETTALIDGNQISVEKRFFAPSQPQPPDWSKLTIWQAAADRHRIAEAFKTIYTRRWLSTGSSKGGMASVYHRRFFPDDVSGRSFRRAERR